MKARLTALGVMAVILVGSVVLAGPLFPVPKHPVPIPIPNIQGTWSGSGKAVKFGGTGGWVVNYEMDLYISGQDGSLFIGAVINEECGGLFPVGGYLSGHISSDGKVNMTIFAECDFEASADNPPTHLFSGQLSGDKKRISGFLQSMEDSSTIKITFEEVFGYDIFSSTRRKDTERERVDLA